MYFRAGLHFVCACACACVCVCEGKGWGGVDEASQVMRRRSSWWWNEFQGESVTHHLISTFYHHLFLYFPPRSHKTENGASAWPPVSLSGTQNSSSSVLGHLHDLFMTQKGPNHCRSSWDLGSKVPLQKKKKKPEMKRCRCSRFRWLYTERNKKP